MATEKQRDSVSSQTPGQVNGPATSGPGATPSAAIVNNRVAGTRITVWDIFYYLESRTSHEDICQILGLTMDQVHAAVQYIKDNEAYVLEVHRKIEERNARGHPPEVQAKVDAAHARFTEFVKTFREAQSKEVDGARNSGRQ
jgi:uncharacterized protein (DUF433 family)